MKKYIFILIIISQIPCFASQIVVGLSSKNIIVKNIWERNSGELKHFLYVYNKTQKEINLEIKLNSFESNGTNFHLADSHTIYTNQIAPNLITKFEYPQSSTNLDFMCFIEDGIDIGLLNFNAKEPEKSFVNDQYNFYSNEIDRSVEISLWLRYKSLSDPSSEVGVLSIEKASDYLLLRFANDSKNDLKKYEGKLDSLQKTDKSIIKLDQSNNVYTFKLNKDFRKENVLYFYFIIESIARNKVKKDYLFEIPVFFKP